ncbi:hypothetical protein [Microbacterium oleivorans]|uniref:Uncharacterized protein n=1 Tax=Microbacterium oleivorans TaxID=273677 RepID=A0A7D5EWY7_9MICO|nr:hypothetical protein [Microbacterium oleivorans]QLD10888.1 hypothetical protein HW566_03270 [Microbacterium oleivorans]
MDKLLQLTSGRLTIRQSPQGEARPRGLYFGPGGFTGWDDGVTMRSETIARPQAHGDFDTPGYLSGRLVPMKGTCFADSMEDLEEMRDMFVGHGGDGGKFTVTVERNGRTLFGSARQAAGTTPTFEDIGTGRRAKWSASWWFPDPLKYGAAFDFPAGQTVLAVHRGNFPARPRLRVYGDAGGGYTITGPGGRLIVITRPLVAGQPHTFDTATGRLTIGGARALGGIARSDLFTLPPTSATTISVSNGLTLQVLGNETYL